MKNYALRLSLLLNLFLLLVCKPVFSQNYAKNNQADLFLMIKTTNNKPVQFTEVTAIEKQTGNVLKAVTNTKGKVRYKAWRTFTYAIVISNRDTIAKITIPKTGMGIVTKTLTYNPPVEKKAGAAPDTIKQENDPAKKPSRSQTLVVIHVRTAQDNPVPVFPVRLKSKKLNKIYKVNTDNEGIARFLVFPGVNYYIGLGEFDKYQMIDVPYKANIIYTHKLRFQPKPPMEEIVRNDTVYQKFDKNTGACSALAYIFISIKDLSFKPIQYFPVYLDVLMTPKKQHGLKGFKPQNAKANDAQPLVYSAITDKDGEVAFLLPKGKKYSLSFFTEKDMDSFSFPKDAVLYDSRIDYITKGMVFDKKIYQQVEETAMLIDTDYEVKPSASIKNYCPEIGDQGDYGTCVAWASAFYARTIIEAKQKKLTKAQINNETFSPTWIYEQIKFEFDSACKFGSYIEKAMDVMKKSGTAKLYDLKYQCGAPITPSIRSNAVDYKIKDYKRLFDLSATNETKIKRVKKTLSQQKPVIIGFNTPPSFFNAGTRWNPANNDSPRKVYGGHAMTVIGYDDNKFGGAFEVINSWDTKWGNNGFAWIRYKDFASYCLSAFEIIEGTDLQNKDAIPLAGKVVFTSKNNKIKVKRQNNDYMLHYTLQTKSPEIKLKISGTKPAYIYALHLQSQKDIEMLFPPNNTVSPHFSYTENTVQLPYNQNSLQISDNNQQSIILLYSFNRLDIERIKNLIKTKRDIHLDDMIALTGRKFVNPEKIETLPHSIDFKTTTDLSHSIVAIMIDIK